MAYSMEDWLRNPKPPLDDEWVYITPREDELAFAKLVEDLRDEVFKAVIREGSDGNTTKGKVGYQSGNRM